MVVVPHAELRHRAQAAADRTSAVLVCSDNHPSIYWGRSSAPTERLFLQRGAGATHSCPSLLWISLPFIATVFVPVANSGTVSAAIAPPQCGLR